MVELDTPYFSGRTKVLCMDNPVQDIIIGNIPGASGVHRSVKPHQKKEVIIC